MALGEELLKLAAGVAVQQFSAPYRVAFERRIGGVVVCGVLAALAGLTASGCALAALWLWLAPQLGQAEAALLCAVAMLVVAILLATGIVLMTRRTETKNPANVLKDVLNSKELLGLVEKHIPELVIAAAVGGLVLGLRGRSKK